MTEAEWLACTDPQKMLEFLRGKAIERKLRLFICACCRTIWHLLTDKRTRQAIEIVEQYVDGMATQEMLAAAESACYSAANEAIVRANTAHDSACCQAAGPVLADFHAFHHAQAEVEAAFDAHAATNEPSRLAGNDEAYFSSFEIAIHATCMAAGYATGNDPDTSAFTDTHAIAARKLLVILRDIFGNPFCPVPIDPTWRTSTVMALAQATYNARSLPAGTLNPDRLLVLADALEDAGCTDATILDHLRGPGPHVRGCWVIDALLGKS